MLVILSNKNYITVPTRIFDGFIAANAIFFLYIYEQ